MYDLNICHLYPDVLNIYGDMGNITALSKRAKWRGINVNICNITLGDGSLPETCDIVFIGGGQDYEQEIIRDDLVTNKGSSIKDAIENWKVFLCICGGYQILGKYYRTCDGKEIEFLGALDFWTIGGDKRMIGNIIIECDFLKKGHSDGMVVGFENHSGRTYLGPGAKPLGTVLKGYGNNGEDLSEGALYKNVYCSYMHGSLLPKNPFLADHLIELALRRKYKDFESLKPLDDRLEDLARKAAIARFIR